MAVIPSSASKAIPSVRVKSMEAIAAMAQHYSGESQEVFLIQKH